MYLSDFHSIRPAYESTQEETLAWLVDAHVQAECKKGNQEIETFRKTFHEKLFHVGCKPSQIAKRGHILSDFLHRDWGNMLVYQLGKEPYGADLDVRLQAYKEYTDRILEEFYEEIEDPPGDLIHVTCTGYTSPSCAQRIVSTKGWGQKTVVTHAYHMGCYAAFPALRMAKGFIQEKESVDIVHTEICSLHSNPSLHSLDQLVSQSLFADGCIKYTVKKEGNGNGGYGNYLKLHTLREEIIPHSLKSMSWDMMHWGFQMFLSKEVPILIARSLKDYLDRLSQNSSWSLDALCKEAVFAIHPGGPKIVSHLQKILNLTDLQMHHTNYILHNCGNMSSATLPYVWEALLQDSTIENGAPIVSLAFGPGLSICGAILEKRCG